MAEYVFFFISGADPCNWRGRLRFVYYLTALLTYVTFRCLLASLLACNQELVQAFTAYNQMMERQHLSKATKASETGNAAHNRNGDDDQYVPTQDLLSFGTVGSGDGAGVGNGHAHSNGNGRSANANGKSVAHNVAQDPFADEPYSVALQSDVKMG